MNSSNVRGTICALLSGICWGFSGTVGQYLFTSRGTDPGWLTVVRMCSAGLILLVYSAVRRPAQTLEIWRDPSDALRLLIFAVAGLMAVQFSYMKAISFSNAGTATALQYLGEALILLYACIVHRRLPKFSELFGLLLALAGIFLIATHGSFTSLALSPASLVWGIICAVTLMLYTVLPSDLTSRYSNAVVTGWGMLIGGVTLALILRVWRIGADVDIGLILSLSAIVIVGTVAAFSLYLTGVSDLGPVKAGLLASIEAVAAPVFAALWLKTTFSPADYAGFGCMLAMSVMLSLPALRGSVRKTAGKYGRAK